MEVIKMRFTKTRDGIKVISELQALIAGVSSAYEGRSEPYPQEREILDLLLSALTGFKQFRETVFCQYARTREINVTLAASPEEIDLELPLLFLCLREWISEALQSSDPEIKKSALRLQE